MRGLKSERNISDLINRDLFREIRYSMMKVKAQDRWIFLEILKQTKKLMGELILGDLWFMTEFSMLNKLISKY